MRTDDFEFIEVIDNASLGVWFIVSKRIGDIVAEIEFDNVWGMYYDVNLLASTYSNAKFVARFIKLENALQVLNTMVGDWDDEVRIKDAEKAKAAEGLA